MPLDTTIMRYTLSPRDVAVVRSVIDELDGLVEPPTDPAFYDRHWDAYLRLPTGLRVFLERFRRDEPAAGCLVQGFPTPDEEVDATPDHWESALASRTGSRQEIFMALCGLALGDPFTWSTLQTGAMIQNILPIRGEEQRQSGHSSDVFLEFHTEDGFHPARCDYLLLFGMRNHDAVPTYLASVRDVRLSDEDRAVLSRPRFLIRPDDEHVRQLRQRHPDHPALGRATAMREAPEPVSVLFGAELHPYLRIDRPFMRCVDDDPVAQRAVEALMTELRRVSRPVVIEPGSLLVVDNYLAVHGRKAFRSRYDGTDRWLKRMIVSRDLRTTAVRGHAAGGRVLF
ncbi:guanitoxin biosynthesis L-enduracididine beta-hydroxylase GntD [Micromonospora schwarzwaldensis]|uniref:guanitoxin biosynthesis L-enduracididine beta-hydroxylase GntD n=1 Tax=Micromonospora sp. DSM 45708 TaxID=3111767 RepID=UPI0031DA610E